MSRTKDPIRPLGRNTEATRRHWDSLKELLPKAGNPLRGEVPAESIDLSLFRHPYPWFQRRGFCVGYALAAIGMDTWRIPNGVRPGSKPLDPIQFSPLYTYQISRMEAKRKGMRIGGDGSLCSLAISASCRDGFLLWDKLPATPQREDSWSNNTDLPGTMLQEGRDKLLLQYVQCASFEQGLEHLAAGFMLYAGTPVYDGWMNTDGDGRFRPLSGRMIGGHAWRIYAYSKTRNEAKVGNSWPQWGIPDASSPGGYQNVAICLMTDLERLFSQADLANGTSELYAVNVIQGEPTGDPFSPKIDLNLLIP